MKKLLSTVILTLLAAWDAAAQDTPRQDSLPGQIEIEEVVVTARGRDRARRYFRRYVRRMPGYGWYTGFDGVYRIGVDGFKGWNSQGTYVRNHIPGDDANRFQIDLFTLKPQVAADSINAWQIQRYILLAGSIAERAADLGHESDATLSYRGREEEKNVFTISEAGGNERRNFRTRILVHDPSGIVARSESVSSSPSGVWNVAASYAVFDGFIYPVRVAATFEQKDPLSGEQATVEVELADVSAHRFERREMTDKYWRSDGITTKRVLKQREKILKLRR